MLLKDPQNIRTSQHIPRELFPETHLRDTDKTVNDLDLGPNCGYRNHGFRPKLSHNQQIVILFFL